MRDIEESACWVFTVGNAKLQSVESSDHFDSSTAEGFEFKVDQMKFEYASNYTKWRQSK